MIISRPAASDPGWRSRRLVAVVLLAALIGSGTHARAQAYLDRRANTNVDMTGRMFDANPSLSGGRYNYVRPLSPLMSGNAYAEGNIRFGQSLRIDSPVSDSLTFRGSLGSGSLSTFRRDSVSVADSLGPQNTSLFGQRYYDPSTTVGTVGFLRGMTTPAAATGLAGDLRLDTRMRPETGLTAQIIGLESLMQPDSATSSGIFGLPAPPRVPLPYDPTAVNPWETWQRPRMEEQDADQPTGPRISSRIYPLPAQDQDSALATPLDILLRAELSPQVGMVDQGGQPLPWVGRMADGEVRPGLILPERGAEEMDAARRESGAPRITDPSLLPGYDVFHDLRLALALSESAGAGWFQELQAAMEAQPELVEGLPEEAVTDAAGYIEKVREMPLRTFAGTGSSALNNEMLKAESLMSIGHYQEAADHYRLAALIDPTNPLPWVGRGHALLAVGEYRSAAYALLRGLELFPELARFAVSLEELMGSGEIIDMRRADILERLEQRENAELRFLLGYLEYHTGDRERGMANLERAARDPRASAIIARYPALLRGGRALPVPPSYEHSAIDADSLPAGQAGGETPDLTPGGPTKELVLPPPPARAQPDGEKR